MRGCYDDAQSVWKGLRGRGWDLRANCSRGRWWRLTLGLGHERVCGYLGFGEVNGVRLDGRRGRDGIAMRHAGIIEIADDNALVVVKDNAGSALYVCNGHMLNLIEKSIGVIRVAEPHDAF